MQPPSLTAAAAIVEALVAAGVNWVVLSPGSRSAPMAYALAEAEDAGLLGLRVVLDERSAGFTALGMSRAALLAGHRAPAAVVTTSGTAVANLHPALAEADAAGIPLLVVSTDRPHELVGTGANQTTEQAGIFALAPRATADIPADLTAPAGLGEEAGRASIAGQVRRAVLAAAGTLTRDPGPAHINARFRPPLAPVDGPILGDSPGQGASAPSALMSPSAQGFQGAWGAWGVPDDAEAQVPAPRIIWEAPAPPSGAADEPGRARGLVVAGDCPDPALGDIAARVAERLGWPLLAEPTSGARHGATAQPRYAELLATSAGRDLAARASHILVAGHPSLSRPISALLAREDARISVLADRARITDVAGTAGRVIAVDPAPTATGRADQAERIAGLLGAAVPSWGAEWRSAVAALEPPSVAGSDAALDADDAAVAVWESCAPTGQDGEAPLLVVGSSMTIRRLGWRPGARPRPPPSPIGAWPGSTGRSPPPPGSRSPPGGRCERSWGTWPSSTTPCRSGAAGLSASPTSRSSSSTTPAGPSSTAWSTRACRGLGDSAACSPPRSTRMWPISRGGWASKRSTPLIGTPSCASSPSPCAERAWSGSPYSPEGGAGARSRASGRPSDLLPRSLVDLARCHMMRRLASRWSPAPSTAPHEDPLAQAGHR